MDFSNIGKAHDRISELPSSILHHVLSFLDIKSVARTSLLSKRWKYVWTSVPSFEFLDCSRYSLSETIKFMEFVDRTLHLHDRFSNIQKFHLATNGHMSTSRVHSWIENLTGRNVEDVVLYLRQDEPFFIPISLFTCESLIRLELNANDATHLPRSFCFPKLKSLTLRGIQFTDDCGWNEQHFSSFPVLEDLTLEDCTWFSVKNFCISAPALKFLMIEIDDISEDDGLENCALAIHAPNLETLFYCGSVAKDYVFPSFEKLKYASVFLIPRFGVPSEQNIGYGVSKFLRMVSHVQRLDMYPQTLEALSEVDDFVNILPVFQDLEMVTVKEGETTDESLFPFLKAAPNVTWLEFAESCLDHSGEKKPSWAGHLSTAGCIFERLESVCFVSFSGKARQMRWVKLILKKAKALSKMKLYLKSVDSVNKEALKSKILSLPKAS